MTSPQDEQGDKPPSSGSAGSDDAAEHPHPQPPVGIEETGPIPVVDREGVQDSSDEGLLASSAVMAVGSAISRLTGVLRDMALTAALGLYIVRDAFALGNSLPNIIYIMVIGGALNAVFVPQLVRRMREDADAGKAYTDALLSATGTVLLVLSVLAVLAAPFLVGIYASASYSDDQLALSVAFARYCLPQIFFYGLYTMLAQVLNARGHFAMPMFAPIANNIVAIGVYLSFAFIVGTEQAATGYLTPEQTAWLGLGTTLGVAIQALVLIPVIGRAGYHFGFTLQWRGLGLGKAARLAGWTIGLVLANQISWIVTTRLATTANVNAAAAGEPPAGLATYQTANLIFMLPHGIVTVSIVTALLPALSRTVDAGRLKEAGSELARTTRTVLLLIAPLGVGMFMLASPAAALLFGYGAADAAQVEQLAIVTQIFALGLAPFTVYYVLLRGWYAMEDTRTPFFMALVLNAINVTLALSLFSLAGPGAPQVNALAAAYIMTYWLIVLLAWPILARRYRGLETPRTLVAFVKIAVASLVGFTGGWLMQFWLGTYDLGDSKLQALWTLTYVGLGIFIAYGVAVWLLRIEEASILGSTIRSRLPGRSG